jgi:hypothetical protein
MGRRIAMSDRSSPKLPIGGVAHAKALRDFSSVVIDVSVQPDFAV